MCGSVKNVNIGIHESEKQCKKAFAFATPPTQPQTQFAFVYLLIFRLKGGLWAIIYVILLLFEYQKVILLLKIH